MQNIADRMNAFIARAQAASTREEGQGTVEYILIAGVIAFAVVAAANTGLGTAVTGAVSDIATKLTTTI